MKPTTRLRQLLNEKGFIVAPGCFDPMSARIVEYLGFDVAYMGGQSTGQHLVIGEPQVTLTEQVEEAHKATRVIDIPLIVDAGAGFGEPVHVIRCIREFEDAGIAGVHAPCSAKQIGECDAMQSIPGRLGVTGPAAPPHARVQRDLLEDACANATAESLKEVAVQQTGADQDGIESRHAAKV